MGFCRHKLSLCLFVYYIINLARGIKVEPLSLPYGNDYCYFRCVAKCLETETGLDNCAKQCKSFQNETIPVCKKDDLDCWKKCKNLTDGLKTDELQSPVLLYANYTIDPPSPRLALLEWTPVPGAKLYVVQYTETDEPFLTFARGGLGNVVTTSRKIQIKKKNLCPEYQFRVAAVNKNTVSVFSDVLTLPKPVPVVPNPNVFVISRELINTDMPFEDVTQKQLGNGTVRVTLGYHPPPGWNLSTNDYSPYFTYTHLINCRKCDGNTPSFANPIVRPDPNDPVAYIDFPRFTFECDCLIATPLDYLQSKCGTTFTYSSSDNPDSQFMFHITCANTNNTNCYIQPKVMTPQCLVENFLSDHKLINNNSTMESVTLHWNSPRYYANDSVLYWMVKITQAEKDLSPIYPAYNYKSVKELGIRKVCEKKGPNEECQNGSIKMTVNDVFQAGFFYAVHVCAVFNESTENMINWNVTGFYGVNLLDDLAERTGKTNRDEDSNKLTIGLAVGISLFFALLAVAVTMYVLISRRHCAKPKSINQLGLDGRPENDDGRYVMMPRRFDHWELPRKRLIVFEDQKLGSGAFGAVYKGRIDGKVLTHKDSQSVLAENWMRAEDCDVAVKMLPEYADDTSKSDFRKEINLMKQLGYHERLVNMLACITADDPLCLIVEYCSDGDLLHFLRDRRKYMIKLEQNNVDLHNLSEDNDVDYSLILCLKDLISFAWQISVGMEYLSQKGFIHRDVAARNILVDKGKRAKIGDFGLCRYSYNDTIYMGKGGRLPIKWMALEAIKNYEFTIKSDVWSFGVLLFEIITLGGSPYPGIQPSDMEQMLEQGNRMDQPDNCPNELYEMMLKTWMPEADKRPCFTSLRDHLRVMLEQLTVDYSYLSLNQKRDYYNVVYGEEMEKNSSDFAKHKAFKNFTFTPDHDIELNSDNILSDNVFMPETPKASDPEPPRKLHSIATMPVTNLLHNAVHTDSISLTDDGPMTPKTPATVTTLRDSTSSDNPLITPDSSGNASGKKPYFFKFFKPPLEDLPETTNATDLSSDKNP